MIECVEWGGCGIFVWSVYGLSLLTFIMVGGWPIVNLWKTKNQIYKQLHNESMQKNQSID